MKVLIGLAVLIVVLVVVVALQPAAFRITRAATIAAPPAAVFAQVNDLHNWEAWSPWAKADPGYQKTYEGAAAGVGAAFAWSGNNKVGAGRMTITDSRPHERVALRLEFVRPFKATNLTEFTFVPEGEQTRVTWTMTGEKNFVSKAFGLIVDMDKLVGRDFEKGLAEMKALAEATAMAR